MLDDEAAAGRAAVTGTGTGYAFRAASTNSMKSSEMLLPAIERGAGGDNTKRTMKQTQRPQKTQCNALDATKRAPKHKPIEAATPEPTQISN